MKHKPSIWSNDDVLPTPKELSTEGIKSSKKVSLSNQKSSREIDIDETSSEEYQEIVSEIKNTESPSSSSHSSSSRSDSEKWVVDNPQVSDLDYLRSRISQKVGFEDGEGDSEKGGPKSEGEENESSSDDERGAAAGGGSAATSTATTATSTATGTATATTSSSSGIHGASKDQLIKKEEEEMENLSGSSQNTLYVKNLNWDTDEATLKDHFSKFGKIRSLTIAKKRDMKKEGKLLSLGYGFVEFNEREEAMEAFKKLQGELLDGHSLEISFSQKGQREKSNLDRKQTQREKKSNKLMVKNVPFQANENELRKLFSTYGELKVVRLPWRQGGKRHRGFAFVEYLTKEEATNAMEMLANTHLYGRHLVIDYAKEEEGLEDVREKTKRLFKQI
eukprot:TRINITY_DN7426_c0_g1_i6.p1 TRINITY_DN7426_c0_g1~~TRINITY_DN7426_c0_g1_i6.p1  ORF type:complete len:411 (-),score=124.79 TRINITY_DN7426_c0_g1_i6:186-1358(-)